MVNLNKFCKNFLRFRYLYTIQHLWLHRVLLKQYVIDQKLQSSTVLSISPQQLYAQGLRTMVIDFDGVLAAHAADTIDVTVEQWLAACVACFGRERVFVLSNKPTKARENYFATRAYLPQFFVAQRKKPFPDGLLAIMQQCGCHAHEMLVIDDRLATGILAAIIASKNTSMRAILITQPTVNFVANPVRESFFWLLRALERCMYRW